MSDSRSKRRGEEHEAEEYRKDGRIRKYAQGGEVDDSDRPEERGPVGLYYNRLLRDRRANKAREKEFEPDLRSEQIVLGAKKAARGPSAGGPERLAREAAEDATRRRNRTAFYQGIERGLEGMLDREGARIGQRRDPTRVEDNGYKKGGKVKAKAAPIKKAAGGKVAAKAPVKKAMGGKVAAKPMSRPVAKAKPMARPMPAMKRGGKVMMKGKYK